MLFGDISLSLMASDLDSVYRAIHRQIHLTLTRICNLSQKCSQTNQRPDNYFCNCCCVLTLVRAVFDYRVKYLVAATKLGQGNVFTGVCDSVHGGGGVSASVHAGMPAPRDQRPPLDQADTPRDQRPTPLD